MPEPLFAYGLLNDTDTRDATIALHQFAEWGVPCRPIAIFHEQEAIGRNVLARFSDVCGQQFSSLVGNRERITRFLKDRLAG